MKPRALLRSKEKQESKRGTMSLKSLLKSKKKQQSEMSQYLAFMRERNALAQLIPRNDEMARFKKSRLEYLDRMIVMYRKKICGKNYISPR